MNRTQSSAAIFADDHAPVAPAQPGFDPYLPPEMAARAEAIGETKSKMDTVNLLGLAVLAGAFIALGAGFFTTVTTSTDLGYGVTRLIGGLAFSLGLILVVLAGAELFTGDNLIVMAWASGRVKLVGLLRVWALVYVGNFVGSVATVLLLYLSGQWRFAGNEVGANALRIASAKVNLDWTEALFLGILCNALVCLAVWLTYSARSNLDKAVGIVFPITAFVASGFEHSVANMYFVPLGILLKSKDAVVAAAGLDSAALADLDWLHFAYANLLPVTIGNIIGGGLMVGIVYWLIYRRNGRPIG